MLNPGAPQFASGDSESLQADVMRFMAIIAFCLIAILALVRNTEPAVAEPQPPTPRSQPLPEPSAALPLPALAQAAPIQQPGPGELAAPLPALATSPEPAPVPAAPLEAVQSPTAAMEAPQKARLPEDAPLDSPDPVTAEVMPQRATTIERPVQPERSSTAPAPSQVAQPTPPSEAGLSLRFASDSDFLRLIARGEISVYAFSGTDVLQLDSGYQFAAAPSPGQVYELLPDSVPSLIGEALDRARPSSGNYRWGIALPRRISARIEQYLNTVEQGQLVIDRYGDVHHVAAT
jgi:hypothetical protein